MVEGLTEALSSGTVSGPGFWIDCTLGGGGHTAELLSRLEPFGDQRVVAIDQDPQAIERARERFASEISRGRLELQQARFSEVARLAGDRRVLGLMADLGFSSDQMDDPERGLSFKAAGPVDMRLDPSKGESLASKLTRVAESELADVIWQWGEERFSRRIARAIIRAREEDRRPKIRWSLRSWCVALSRVRIRLSIGARTARTRRRGHFRL